MMQNKLPGYPAARIGQKSRLIGVIHIGRVIVIIRGVALGIRGNTNGLIVYFIVFKIEDEPGIDNKLLVNLVKILDDIGIKFFDNEVRAYLLSLFPRRQFLNRIGYVPGFRSRPKDFFNAHFFQGGDIFIRYNAAGSHGNAGHFVF
jgi:hypothetical protein